MGSELDDLQNQHKALLIEGQKLQARLQQIGIEALKLEGVIEHLQKKEVK